MNKNQINGKTEEIKGTIKEAAGVLTNDKEMQITGSAQKNIGKIEKFVGDIKEEIKK